MKEGRSISFFSSSWFQRRSAKKKEEAAHGETDECLQHAKGSVKTLEDLYGCDSALPSIEKAGRARRTAPREVLEDERSAAQRRAEDWEKLLRHARDDADRRVAAVEEEAEQVRLYGWGRQKFIYNVLRCT